MWTSEKFVRKGPFWNLSRKHSHLQKLLMHSYGKVVEPGGREQRAIENNPRFNYKLSLEEGTPALTVDEQKLLGMQPSTYTVYLRNLAQTVSRSLSGVTEVIAGLDTTWLGGKNASQNYLNQRYTLPVVRQEMCQGLASKQDSAMSYIEKSIVSVSHKTFMLPQDQTSNTEHVSTLPGAGFGGPPA